MGERRLNCTRHGAAAARAVHPPRGAEPDPAPAAPGGDCLRLLQARDKLHVGGSLPAWEDMAPQGPGDRDAATAKLDAVSVALPSTVQPFT